MERNGILLAILCLLFGASNTILWAQVASHSSFRNFGSEAGIPSPEVYCIFQDQQGYMWFGTDNGATRFNGYTFTNYGPANGLLSNVVFDIKEDSKGAIWFGTMTGELFVFEKDSIRAYQYNHLILEYRKKYSIANLLNIDSQGLVTLSLRGLGILQIDSEGCVQLITTQTPLGGLIVLDKNKIWKAAVAHVDDTNYWNVSYKHYVKQLFYVEIKSGTQTKTVIVNKKAINGSPFNVFAIDSVGQRFLMQTFNNLYLFENDRIIWNSEFNETINALQMYNNGEILLCLGNEKGLRIYDNVEDIKLGYYRQLLDNFSVSQSFADNNGGFWVSTLGNGLFYCKDKDMQVWDMGSDKFKSDLVAAIAIKSNKEIYFGLSNGQVYLVDILTRKAVKLADTNDAQQAYVNSLFFDKKTNTIYKNGWSLKGNNEWQPFRHKLPGVKSAILLTCVYPSEDGKFLWGGSNRGFYKINLAAKQAIFHSDIELNIIDRTFSIYEDKRKRLWLGLQTGITQFINEKLVKPNVNHPAFNIRVEAIDETPDSTLVFGTKGFGVVFWKGNRIVNITDKEGLTSSMIEDIHVDENGTVWVATLNGLNKITYTPDGNAIVRSVTIAQGLPSNEIYQIDSFEGQVWLATGGGLVKYHELPPSKVAIPPFFTNLKVNAKEFALSTNNLTYYQNNIELYYLAINYSLNGKILYRYRLDKQAKWTTTYSTSVNLPALKAGNYFFELQAQNEDAVWSSSAVYQFTISAPWWERWPFRLAVCALVLLGVTAGYRNRIKQLHFKNKTQQKIYELEGKALQAQMNPHFIFNCLNSIKSLINNGESESANTYLNHFAKLIRANLMASRQGEIVLADELDMISGYINLEKLRFKDRFDFSIEVDPKIDIYDTFLPPMLVQPFIENAVIHAFKNRQDKGLIKVCFIQTPLQLIIKIIDNGNGLSYNKKDNNEHPHVSVGIDLVRSRIALLNGKIEENSVTLREIINTEGVIGGTEVEILLNNK